MRLLRRLTFTLLFLLTLLTGGLQISAVPEGEVVFRIPYQKIDRYQASIYEEVVEATTMNRVRLTGRKDLVYDPVDGMILDQNYPLASAAFTSRFDPTLRYEVTSFSANLLNIDFGVDLLLAYLRHKTVELGESNYSLLLAPEKTTGPARFRIFGKRALSFTYSFTRDELTVVRGENWIEKDGVIHIVAIEASNQQSFDRFFERVRQATNSMSYIE
jgi:hypothetical protein